MPDLANGILDVLSDDGDVLVSSTSQVVQNAVVQNPDEELTVTGNVTAGVRVVTLNHATVAVVATMIEDLAVGQELWVINTSASGTAAHTITLNGTQTFDGTNQTATLDAPGEMIKLVCGTATRLYELANIGTVVYS